MGRRPIVTYRIVKTPKEMHDSLINTKLILKFRKVTYFPKREPPKRKATRKPTTTKKKKQRPFLSVAEIERRKVEEAKRADDEKRKRIAAALKEIRDAKAKKEARLGGSERLRKRMRPIGGDAAASISCGFGHCREGTCTQGYQATKEQGHPKVKPNPCTQKKPNLCIKKKSVIIPAAILNSGISVQNIIDDWLRAHASRLPDLSTYTIPRYSKKEAESLDASKRVASDHSYNCDDDDDESRECTEEELVASVYFPKDHQEVLSSSETDGSVKEVLDLWASMDGDDEEDEEEEDAVPNQNPIITKGVIAATTSITEVLELDSVIDVEDQEDGEVMIDAEAVVPILGNQEEDNLMIAKEVTTDKDNQESGKMLTDLVVNQEHPEDDPDQANVSEIEIVSIPASLKRNLRKAGFEIDANNVLIQSKKTRKIKKNQKEYQIMPSNGINLKICAISGTTPSGSSARPTTAELVEEEEGEASQDLGDVLNISNSNEAQDQVDQANNTQECNLKAVSSNEQPSEANEAQDQVNQANASMEVTIQDNNLNPVSSPFDEPPPTSETNTPALEPEISQPIKRKPGRPRKNPAIAPVPRKPTKRSRGYAGARKARKANNPIEVAIQDNNLNPVPSPSDEPNTPALEPEILQPIKRKPGRPRKNPAIAPVPRKPTKRSRGYAGARKAANQAQDQANNPIEVAIPDNNNLNPVPSPSDEPLTSKANTPSLEPEILQPIKRKPGRPRKNPAIAPVPRKPTKRSRGYYRGARKAKPWNSYYAFKKRNARAKAQAKAAAAAAASAAAASAAVPVPDVPAPAAAPNENTAPASRCDLPNTR